MVRATSVREAKSELRKYWCVEEPDTSTPELTVSTNAMPSNGIPAPNLVHHPLSNIPGMPAITMNVNTDVAFNTWIPAPNAPNLVSHLLSIPCMPAMNTDAAFNLVSQPQMLPMHGMQRAGMMVSMTFFLSCQLYPLTWNLTPTLPPSGWPMGYALMAIISPQTQLCFTLVGQAWPSQDGVTMSQYTWISPTQCSTNPTQQHSDISSTLISAQYTPVIHP